MALPPTLLFATTNLGKIKELRTFFSSRAPGLRVASPQDLGEPVPEVEENGSTYRANALLKARAFYGTYGVPVLADDSGLEVEALDGGPGIYSARFGGEAITWPERWEALYQALDPRPEPWAARFRCVLCYFDGSVPWYTEGTVEGFLLSKARGGEGFGYDPIFFCPELGKTFGEASPEEKDRVSHRARALEVFWKTLSVA
jgi:XTP/dITP diphosphohydrolase